MHTTTAAVYLNLGCSLAESHRFIDAEKQLVAAGDSYEAARLKVAGGGMDAQSSERRGHPIGFSPPFGQRFCYRPKRGMLPRAIWLAD